LIGWGKQYGVRSNRLRPGSLPHAGICAGPLIQPRQTLEQPHSKLKLAAAFVVTPQQPVSLRKC
jgi:hypothetical protein